MIFWILFRACSHNIVDKQITLELFFFKLSNLISNFTLILGYLNQALNNPAEYFEILILVCFSLLSCIRKFRCVLEKIVVFQKISLCSGKHYCVSEEKLSCVLPQ